MLFHGSRASNFVGILSRGLLMPKCVNNANEQELTRTDIGHLGYGIYFSDDIRTSLKYALTSESKHTRLIAVCEVALGECKQMHDYDTTLTRAPQGYNSVRGVKRDENFESKFSDDEYVIYDLSQYRIKYIVEMHLPNIDGNAKRPLSDDEMYLTNSSSNSKSEHEMDVSLVKVEKGKKNVKLNELGMI
jgi:poly [ADP-ribose] polymerase 2/3/4